MAFWQTRFIYNNAKIALKGCTCQREEFLVQCRCNEHHRFTQCSQCRGGSQVIFNLLSRYSGFLKCKMCIKGMDSTQPYWSFYVESVYFSRLNIFEEGFVIVQHTFKASLRIVCEDVCMITTYLGHLIQPRPSLTEWNYRILFGSSLILMFKMLVIRPTVLNKREHNADNDSCNKPRVNANWTDNDAVQSITSCNVGF